jgi:putative copper export protein
MRVDETTIRVFLHLLGVSVWIGGQIALAALIPVARAAGPDVPRRLARRFVVVAWPFFALAVLTGVWNLLRVDIGDRDTAYQITLGVKLLLVALSGVTAFVHGNTTVPALRGATAGLSLLAALAAAFCGVLLVRG